MGGGLPSLHSNSTDSAAGARRDPAPGLRTPLDGARQICLARAKVASREGRALMTYLSKQGIPFMAFRRAVPGSATGPHIHIGKPAKKTTPAVR